jgi:hypothetical protein
MRRRRIEVDPGPVRLPDSVRANAMRELNGELLARLREATELIQKLRTELKELRHEVSDPPNVEVEVTPERLVEHVILQ